MNHAVSGKHNTMTHGSMDHTMPIPGHGDDGKSGHTCKMNMLFTWEYENICVVFRWWHILSLNSLLLSMLVLIIASAGYEWFKLWREKFKSRLVLNLSSNSNLNSNLPGGFPSPSRQLGLLCSSSSSSSRTRAKWICATLYATQVGWAFMLMLVFMTYNGWLMGAVVVGSGMGNYIFGEALLNGLACH